MAFLAACGHPLGDDFEWPGEDGRTICYPCFEHQADASWWKAVEALQSVADLEADDALDFDESRS